MMPIARFRQPPRAAAIGLVAGLHLALAGLLLAAQRRIEAPPPPVRALLLLPPFLPERAAPPPAAPPARPWRAMPRTAPAVSPVPFTLPAPVPHAEATMTPAPEEVPATPADPFAAPQATAPLAERARASVARVTRELAREAGPGKQRDTLQPRRDRLLDRAVKADSLGLQMEHYTSPDGTIVTRTTGRGGVSCSIPEPYQLRVIPRSANGWYPKSVSCPTGKEAWERR